MNTAHNTSRLDNFLRDTLKNIDIQYQQSDWNDMEALLGPAHKPMNVNISKKNIFISVSVLIVIVIGIIISQTVHFNSSSSEEASPPNTNSPSNVLKTIDTPKTKVSNPVSPAIDSSKKEMSVSIQKNIKSDSIKTITHVDTTSNDKQKKKDKNQKIKKDSIKTDTTSVKKNILMPSVIDSTPSHILHKTKTDSTSAPLDSSKSSTHTKKNKKKKKKKNNSTDSSKTITPAPAKSDSLK